MLRMNFHCVENGQQVDIQRYRTYFCLNASKITHDAWRTDEHLYFSEIAYLLSHLYTVVMRMDGVWVHAFLARARLLDPDFLGRMFSTISK